MRQYVLALSYGNYLIQNGGTDKVIREHCKMFNDVKCDYLFVFPVVRKIKLGKREKNIRFWGFNINEDFIGLFSFDNLLAELESFPKELCRAIFIHHTWRVEFGEIFKICELNNAPIYYYLHDFQSICANRNFINENNVFCGYSLNGLQCKEDCRYHAESVINRDAFRKMMNTLGNRLHCIGPSLNTKKLFQLTFPSCANFIDSIDHQKGDFYAKVPEYNHKKIRIAYIGAQVPIKGWNDFKVLLEVLRNDNYELFYLGTGTDIPSGVKPIKVSVREQGENAMLDALKNNEIDVVLLLSCWPETYSYTYYESYSAGCFVLTYNSSGNIADQVMKNRNGKVFSKLEKVGEYLETPEFVRDDIATYQGASFMIPTKLIPNDEIVKRLVMDNVREENNSYRCPLFRRALLYEIIYKLVNHIF